MAIATLKKIEILGHISQRDDVLAYLQRGGQVEVIDLKDKSDEYKDYSFEQQTIRYEKVTEAVERLSWLMSFFEGLGETRRSVLAPKPVLRRRELLGLLQNLDYDALHSHSHEIESSLREIERREMDLASRRRELGPWIALDVPLQTLGETDFTGNTLGCIQKKTFPLLSEQLESLPGVHLEVVDEDKATACVFVAYLKSTEQETTELLRQHEFAFHHLRHYRGRVEEILREIAEEEEQLDSRHLALLEEAKGLLSEETKVAALLDYFSNVERKEGAKGNLLYSDQTFYLQGWIKEDEAASAERRLQEHFATIDVTTSDPSPDDVLPVVLENRNVVRPFEFLTGIYGYPGYHDVDPTPFMAPFFFVFFGFCLGDAPYGLMLALTSIFVLRKFKMGPQGRRFFRLLLYCGLSTVVVGALTGGWLGDLLGIPALWVNPLKKPVPVLNVALILGIIQIWTGYAVAAYASIRRKRYLDAILDQGPIFVLLTGLTGIGLIFLKALPAEAMTASAGLVGAATVVIFAAHGRHQRSLPEKVLFGGLSWYTALSGYLSDVLSYCRLWALGLVTGAMASTVNLIATTIHKMIPVVGVVLAVVILVGGHAFTLLVNTLGAFVHTIRLQFVEFFSKFFQSSGKPFQPLSIENKFTVIEE
jgi:V/A-type H+-transporting ATPase subunit I